MNRSLLPLLLVLLSGTTRLNAQGRPLTVSGVRSLVFGAVFPGVPRTISRTDPANSGQFDLTGANNNQALLTFTLPLVMTGPVGATLPLSFASSDAGYSSTQAIGSQVAFDPKQPFLATLNKNGRGSVFIGGTGQPGAPQRAAPPTRGPAPLAGDFP